MVENGKSSFATLPAQRALRESPVIEVSDQEGFLCRITLDADFTLTPKELMTIFSNPDNTGVFRDIYAVPAREVVEDDGEGRQKVIVEQLSGFKFLVVPITFSTHLNVERSMKKLTFRYWLNKTGIMKRFAGEWFLKPIYSPDEAEKIIDLLPSFIPFFCGGFIKSVSRNAIQRIVEDIQIFADKYHSGVSFEELLKPKHGKHEKKIESQSSTMQPTEAVQ